MCRRCQSPPMRMGPTFSAFVGLHLSPTHLLTGEQNDITSLTTGSDSLFLGDCNGQIRILSRALRVVRSFNAAESSSHASVTHLKQIESTSLLVSITEDLPNDPVLKVWALDKEDKRIKGPKCLCTIGVQNGRRPFPVRSWLVCRRHRLKSGRYQLLPHWTT